MSVGPLWAKVDALAIILECPQWPRREDLSESGCLIFDDIVANAKRYALAMAMADGVSDMQEAAQIAGRWAVLFNAFMDSTHVVGHEMSERLCCVVKHYLGQWGDLKQLEVTK